ncbi:MAG: NAD(P)/FAD-dependent oxidoreductase [Clostridiales bacterium]|nr:NAD(P)/FAD-dependent oxidoreductase [Clostridiales bacterium]
MKVDVIIVGGGIAGLSAAAFLCRQGRSVLLFEKEDHTGGLVGSFTADGFTFDAGIRAMENSGVLFPMLKNLGLDVEFLPNKVSIGIGNEVVRLTSEDSLGAYREMLAKAFPGDLDDIGALITAVKQTMRYMEVLYGIDNPLFMNLKDRKYLLKTLLPWMVKYALTVGKIKSLNRPVEEHLRVMIRNPALRDMIAQHFFRATPAFFALSYFSLYLDYNYPRGGTGALVRKLEEYIKKHGGVIRTGTRIVSVDPSAQTVAGADGAAYAYEALIWAADMKALYGSVARPERLPAPVQEELKARQTSIADLKGGDSVLTLYWKADLPPEYFGDIHSPHFFYTPDKSGLGSLPADTIRTSGGAFTKNRAALETWMREFLRLTTYEISVPALRDENLAPQGKTGLIVSTLTDYALWKHVEDMGWYEDFKTLCRDTMTDTLVQSVYPALAGRATGGSVSTPLTIARRTGNTDGAITGWAFTNPHIPAVSKMTQIAKSVKTPLPKVWQAGQWTYSPSGFPISILTGKMAADAVLKRLR